MSTYSDIDMERNLIGGLLNGGDVYEAQSLIGPNDLEDENFSRILTAINDVASAGHTVNTRTVAQQLLRNDHAHISETQLEEYRQQGQQGYAEGYVLDYARDLRGLSTKRQIARTLRNSLKSLDRIDKTPNELLSAVQNNVMNLSANQADANQTQEATVGGRALAVLEHNRNRTGGLEGISWGISSLDAMTSGLVDGEFYVVAGRPSMGKTWFALSSACAAAKAEKRVLILSLEMGYDKVAMRLVGQAAKLKVDFGAQSAYTPAEERLFERAATVFDNDLVTIEEATTVSELTALVARAQLLHHRHGLDLIVVDYLQLIGDSNGRHNNRNDEVARVSRSLKLLARQLNVPVLAVAQLNRSVDARSNKRPVMSDLRESGQIEQDADCVIFLYRDNYYDTALSEKKAEVIIGKQRSGATGSLEVYFDPETGHFAALEQHADVPA